MSNRTLGIVVLVGAGFFALGWRFGRRGDAPAAPASVPSVVPAAPPASTGVRLALDASAVTLLPDASLTLRPLDAFDAAPTPLEVDR